MDDRQRTRVGRGTFATALLAGVASGGGELLTAVGDPPAGNRASLTSEVGVEITYRQVGAFQGAVTP